MSRHASMNRAYVLVWNDLQQAYVPAPETARGRGKSTRTILAVAIAGLFCAGPALAAGSGPGAGALPEGGRVTAGQAAIGQTGNSMTVQQGTAKAAIEWSTFNIGKDASVNFVQPSVSAVALNRVVGQDPSQILGALRANGQVFIVNPNGVLFAPGAQVSAAGVLASTRDISTADFMAGKLTLAGSGSGTVVNQGTINAATGGYVVLVGAQVINQGAIDAPEGEVRLAAANQVSLQIAGAGLAAFTIDQGTLDGLAANHGLIKADGGRVYLTADALDQLTKAMVNNQGVIEAQTVDNRSGTIVLKGDMKTGSVTVGGTLDASAPAGGDGGSIETSAASVNIASGHTVTTRGAGGRTGTWLIDPVDFTVAASGGDTTGAQLSTDLAASNVIIQSTAGAAGTAGDINVSDVVTWSANQLTLDAQNNININTSMSGSGTASLALRYGQSAIAAGNTASYNLGDGIKVDLPTGNSLSMLQGSDGVVKNYYVVNTLGADASLTGTDLAGIRANLGGNYALGGDIDASSTASWQNGNGFTFIGTSGSPFTGNFEGLGHTISGLTQNWAIGYIGLIGELAAGGTVSNVALTDVNIFGGLNAVGALVGNNNGTIVHSSVQGTVGGNGTGTGALAGLNAGTILNSSVDATVAGNIATGGLVGLNTGTILNSSSSGAVSGGSETGGLIGESTTAVAGLFSSASVTASGGEAGGLVGRADSTVSNSYASGNVISGDYYAGGLIGQAVGTVSDSHADGTVSGYSNVGGLVGRANDAISNSYATGAVSGSVSVGGLIGRADDAPITNSYATGAVTGSDRETGGLAGYTDSSIDNSYASGNVGGVNSVGGLAGSWQDFNSSHITNSYASGTVTGASEVGGLVGNAQYCFCSLNDSHATGAVTATGDNVGGLIGYVDIGTISNSWASGAVSGAGSVGGLAGFAVQVAGSYATGVVTGQDNVGGLVGQEKVGGTVTGSYATGNVTGSGQAAGGLVGLNSGTVTGASYSTSLVSGQSLVGGLVGRNASGATISDSATGQGLVPGPLVTGVNGTGGLVGQNDGLVTNSAATGSVIGTGDATGGLVGINNNTLQMSSYTTGTVSGVSSVGGAVGSNSGTIAGGTFSTQAVTGSGDAVGGLAGISTGTISGASYATGAVAGQNMVGGLVGMTDGGSVSEASASGAVVGVNQVGGFAGSLGSSTSLANNIASGAVTGVSEVGGFVGRNAAVLSGNTTNGNLTSSIVTVGFGQAGGYAGTNSGTVSDVVSINSVTGGLADVGGIVGVNTGTVQASRALNAVQAGLATNVGGAVGNNASGGIITTTYAANAVTGGDVTGGLVGTNAGSVNVAYASGTVAGHDKVGGLIGSNTGAIADTYATAAVSGNDQVGGLVGYGGGSIDDSYASGAVAGASNTGGLLGSTNGAVVGRSFYNLETTGQAHSTGSFAGGEVGEGKSTADLNSAATYAGWDLSTTGSHNQTWRLYDGLAAPLLTYWLAPVTATATGPNNTYVYDGQAHTEVTGLTYSAILAPEHLLGTAAYLDGKNVGVYTALGGQYSDQQGYDIAYVNEGSLTITPMTLTATAAPVSKTYDGTTLAPSTAAGVTLTGFAAGEGATLSGSGAYNSKDVLTASSVTYGLGEGNVTAAGNTLLSNYIVPVQATGSGTITPVQLGATLATVSKTYDGATTATLAADGFAFNGFVAGEGATGSVSGGQFNSKNVLQANTVTATLSGVAALEGTDLSNYSVPVLASGAGTITPKALVTTATAASKVYDGNATAQATLGVDGVVSGDDLALSGSAVFTDGKNVGVAKAVSVTGISASGADASNYTITGSANTTADITARQLTVSLQGTVSKSADGNTAAVLNSGNYAVGNVVAGEEVAVTRTDGVYNDAETGSGKLVTVSLAAGDYAAGGATLLGNYLLVTGTLAGNVGVITGDNATANLAQISGNVGEVSLPLAYNGLLASLPSPATGGDQQAAGGNGSVPVGTVQTDGASGLVTDPFAPALASSVSSNTRENLLFRRAFSVGDGGIRLPQGVRGSDRDSSQ
jgi:filamentous hemagglutinin family protein